MEESLGEKSKDKFIFDTSAILSVESIDRLDTILEVFSVITTASVLKELEDFAKHEDRLGLIARRVFTKREKFLLQSTAILEKLNDVSSTDEELFNIALKENETMITDDLKLLRHTVGKVRGAFSTYFLTALVHARILNKSEALAKLETMRNIRNWQDNIIYISTKDILKGIENGIEN